LIAFVRQAVEEDCTPIFDLGAHRIVRSRGRVFAIHDDPRLVSGPFASEGALIESEARQEPDGTWFWYEHRFAVDEDGLRLLDS
jgi:hypothetical protein